LSESVRVTIGDDGLVDTVTIDPRAMRKGAEAVAELTREAVRQAQRDWFAGHEATPDSEDRLRERLREIQADYSHRMEEINRALAGLMRGR
jgi:DNA-binding protein YbaB